MANVVRFDHIRRCRRFFRILVDQFGLEYFLAPTERGFAPCANALRESVAFASDWMALRTGEEPTEATQDVMRRELMTLVNRRLSTEFVHLRLDPPRQR